MTGYKGFIKVCAARHHCQRPKLATATQDAPRKILTRAQRCLSRRPPAFV